jgi:putative peptidoglycan lipid II flippase
LVEAYLSRNDPSLYKIALKVFQIFLLTIPFNAGFSILASYCQAEFNFKSPAISGLFQNIIIIFSVLIFSSKVGIFTIPWGYALGTLVQFIYMFLVIKRNKGKIFRTAQLNLKELGFTNKFLILTILIELINQLYILIDRYFYGSVETGGIAALNYAAVLFSLPISIFSLALSTAIFPKISQTFYNKNFEDLQLKIFNGIKINIFIFIPITMLFILFGDSILRVLYQRGNFTFHDTQMTFQILRIYTFSLIFYSSYAIMNKVIYGSGLIKQLLKISIVIFFLKIALNFLLVNNFKQNGLAISTMISYILLTVGVYSLLLRKLKLKNSLSYFYTIVFYLLTGIISYIILLMLKPVVPNFSNSVTAPLLFVLFYISILFFLRPDEYKMFRDAFLKIFAD